MEMEQRELVKAKPAGAGVEAAASAKRNAGRAGSCLRRPKETSDVVRRRAAPSWRLHLQHLISVLQSALEQLEKLAVNWEGEKAHTVTPE